MPAFCTLRFTARTVLCLLVSLALCLSIGANAQQSDQGNRDLTTLLRETSSVLELKEPGEGLSEEEFLFLAENFLGESSLTIDLATADVSLLTQYPGASITLVGGQVLYIAVNPSAEENTVRFVDALALDIPALGLGVAVKGFSEDFEINDLGGSFIVYGAEALVTTTLQFLNVDSVLSEEGYIFNIFAGNILELEGHNTRVVNFYSVIGSEYHDTFSLIGSSITISSSYDGGAGMDSFSIISSETNNWTIDAEIVFVESQGFGVSLINIESLSGNDFSTDNSLQATINYGTSEPCEFGDSSSGEVNSFSSSISSNEGSHLSVTEEPAVACNPDPAYIYNGELTNLSLVALNEYSILQQVTLNDQENNVNTESEPKNDSSSTLAASADWMFSFALCLIIGLRRYFSFWHA